MSSARGTPTIRASASPAVIVTDGRYTGVLAAVRALRAGGYRPWVAASDRGARAAWSRAAAGVVRTPDPGVDPDGFTEALVDAAGRHGLNAILPGTERALVLLAERRDAFSPSVALGTCDLDLVDRATDKLLLGDLAAEAGLETPPTVLRAADGGDFPGMSFPVVVKPARSEMRTPGGGFRHFGTRVAENPESLRRALAALPDARGLVQPFLPGTLVTLNGVAWGGKVLCAVHQRAERLWPPRNGVLAYAVTARADRRLEEAGTKLVGLLGWSGIFNLQFLECAGTRFLIDVNPRIYHSLALAVAAGPNLPAMWCDLLLGRTPVVPLGYRVGLRFRAEDEDLRAIVSAVRAGKLRAGASALRPRRRTVHAGFSVRDPLPAAVTLLRVASRLGSRPRAAGGNPVESA